MSRQTKRQQLISQVRGVLRDLQSPAYFEYNETLIFTIGDTEYEYTLEQLDDELAEWEQ